MNLLITKRVTVTAVTLLLTLLLSACATKHTPDEVCTAEWIKPRVDLALGDFRENTDDLNVLSETCNQPELASRVFKDVLSEYNVPPVFLTLLEDMQQFKALAEQAAKDFQ